MSHYDYLDRVILSSFDYQCLARIRELGPEAAIGVLFDSQTSEDPLMVARRLGATSIHVQKEVVSRGFLEQAWEDALDVYVWTVNEVREMEMYVSMGAQGLISDFPDRFSKLKWH